MLEEQERFQPLLKQVTLFKSVAGERPVITLSWQWIKWYEEFKEVAAIEAFCDSVPSRFVRVGEDFGDVEIRETEGSGFMWEAAEPQIAIYYAGNEVGIEDYLPQSKNQEREGERQDDLP